VGAAALGGGAGGGGGAVQAVAEVAVPVQVPA